MKKILIILFLIIPFCVNAQTDKDILSEIVKQQARVAEQQIEINKQILETNKLVTELVKQQAITSTKVDSLEKSVEKRLDMQSNFMIAILAFIGVLTTGMFSFIAFILWDRKTANQPLDEIKLENSVLKKEVDLLKEKELKHLEREMKVELYIKQISQIDNRFAPFNP